MDNASKTDIVDLLRRIKAGSLAQVEEPNGWSYHTNIGFLANQAADEIEELKTKLMIANGVHGIDILNAKEDARNAALEEAAQIADAYSSNWAGESIAAQIRKIAASSGVGLHASQQPHAVDAATAPRG